MGNNNLPEIGHDLIFKFPDGTIFAGIFDGTEFLTPKISGGISRFQHKCVNSWAYADEAFSALEQQKQTEQQPAQPASVFTDWEQRRYEIARDVLAIDVKTALAYADMLLAELKK